MVTTYYAANGGKKGVVVSILAVSCAPHHAAPCCTKRVVRFLGTSSLRPVLPPTEVCGPRLTSHHRSCLVIHEQGSVKNGDNYESGTACFKSAGGDGDGGCLLPPPLCFACSALLSAPRGARMFCGCTVCRCLFCSGCLCPISLLLTRLPALGALAWVQVTATATATVAACCRRPSACSALLSTPRGTHMFCGCTVCPAVAGDGDASTTTTTADSGATAIGAAVAVFTVGLVAAL